MFCTVGCTSRVTSKLPYSPDFLDLVRTGRVQRVDITEYPGGRLVGVVVVAPENGAGKPQTYRVEIPRRDAALMDTLSEHSVAFSIKQKDPIWSRK